MLLNHSKSESCRAHIERPRGYRTVTGDWVTLNPGLQQLSSRAERDEALASTPSKPETKSPPSGLQMARELTEWAETHQGKFGEKSVRHGLTEMDMSIVHAETLRAGSDAEDYKKFLEQLEIKAKMKETKDTFPPWMVQLGLGCAILSTCWVGGHIGYKGFRIFRKSEDNSGPVKPGNTSRRGRPIVRRERRGGELVYHWEEPDDTGQREGDRGEGRDAWIGDSTELDVSIDMEVEDGDNEPEKNMINTDPQPEGRMRSSTDPQPEGRMRPRRT